MCEKLKLKDILGEEYEDGELQDYLQIYWSSYGFDQHIEVDGVDDLYITLDVSQKVKMTKALDKWRKSLGEFPLFYDEDFSEGELDEDSWYETRVAVHQNKNIELYFWVESYSIGDQIDFELTEKEKETLWKMANTFVKCKLNYTLDELFKGAEANIREYYESHEEDNGEDH